MKAIWVVFLALIFNVPGLAIAQQTNTVAGTTNNVPIAELKSKAEMGDAEAQNSLGLRYVKAEGVAIDYVEANKWFRKSAEQNYAKAQNSLGVNYACGKGVETNLVEALSWYRKAANQNFDMAQFNLGLTYFNGWGITRDYGEAIKWFRKAAEQGNIDALNCLAACYDQGLGIAKDKAEAFKLILKAAETGNTRSEFILGNLYSMGVGIATNEVEGAKWYRKAAEAGNAKAQYILGGIYSYGRPLLSTNKTIKPNADEALMWYRKAAENGHLEAQKTMGDYYKDGFFVKKDKVEAIKWYRMAAEKNDYWAARALGDIYWNVDGDNSGRDVIEAYKWFCIALVCGEKMDEESKKLSASAFSPPLDTYVFLAKSSLTQLQSYWMKKPQIEQAKAFLEKDSPGVLAKVEASFANDDLKEYQNILTQAETGNAWAQSQLGDRYNEGKSVVKDSKEAAKWYRKAADQGFAAAQNRLARHYQEGDGLIQDMSEAAMWYHRAAMQGDYSSMWNLGNCYEQGHGVPKDYVEAYKWYNIAAVDAILGNSIKVERDLLAEKMLPEQIALAQRLSSAFVPKKEKTASTSANSVLPDIPTATATGFFITDDGYLVSNYHVVKGATKVRLRTGAGLLDASVVKVDAANDLAMLKAAGQFTPLPIAASRTVKLGSTVATVGFPSTGLQGFSPKLAKGEIASLAGASDDPRYFQISVPVQPGNSGGALVDARGNVVGIVSAKLSAKAALDATGQLPENVNYAVKSSLLLSFLESVPDVSAKLKEPNTKNEAFEDVVKSAQDAAVLVLVY